MNYLRRAVRTCSSHFQVISENDDDMVITPSFRLLLEDLPSVNFSCMKFLCHFLRQIADNEYYNKMSPVSLGIVFGPNVFRCGEDLKVRKAEFILPCSFFSFAFLSYFIIML